MTKQDFFSSPRESHRSAAKVSGFFDLQLFSWVPCTTGMCSPYGLVV
jgi:hypothetical protein